MSQDALPKAIYILRQREKSTNVKRLVSRKIAYVHIIKIIKAYGSFDKLNYIAFQMFYIIHFMVKVVFSTCMHFNSAFK